MANLSKEEKKALQNKWKAEQDKAYILSKAEVEQLFQFLDERLEQDDCDHSLRFTMEWIRNNCEPEQEEAIVQELNDMGGFCDCEVLENCYERYDL